MFKKDEIYRVTITDMNGEGNGVCRVEGAVFFVIGAVTEDVCDVKVIKVTKNYCVAAIVSIVVPSPYRITPPCPYKRCGGCTLMNVSEEFELRLKKRFVENAFRRAGVNIPVSDAVQSGGSYRYRNKAQFPVGTDKNGKLGFGYFIQRSHDIVFCEDCLTADPEFTAIAATVVKECGIHGLTAYDETTGKGLLRHVCMRRGTGGVLIVIVINGDKLPFADRITAAVVKAHPAVCGVCLNINDKRTNVIYGDKYVTLYGKSKLIDVLCGKTFEISPASFYQVNHECCEALYGKASELLDLKGGETVVDLYCGVGTVGLCSASGAGRLIGVEIVEAAVEDAKINARLNDVENAEFYCGDSSVINRVTGNTPDAIIVDPPRKGLSDEVIGAITGLLPEKLLYISCDPDTLASDLKKLSVFYKADTAYPFNMFPRTGHVETVVLMTRNLPNRSLTEE